MARLSDVCWTLATFVLVACMFLVGYIFIVAFPNAGKPAPSKPTRISVAPPAHARQVAENMWHADIGNNTREVYILHLANRTVIDAPADSCCQFLDFTTDPAGYAVEIRQAPSTDFVQAILDSFNAWQVYAPIFNSVTVSSATPAAVFDGTNQVSFGSIDLPSNVIAVTKLYVSTLTDVLLEADQVYNTGDVPIGFGIASFNLPTVSLHETGHWVGLADLYTSECRPYIMFGILSKGEVKDLDDDTIRCLGFNPPSGSEAMRLDYAVAVLVGTAWVLLFL